MGELILTCCLLNPNLAFLAEQAAKANGIEPELFHALVMVESSFNPKAINKTARIKSYGLAQLTIDTAQHHCKLSKKEIMDPTKNLFCGAKVLRYQLRRYKGDVDKALSAYNAGTYTKYNAIYAIKIRQKMVMRYIARN